MILPFPQRVLSLFVLLILPGCTPPHDSDDLLPLRATKDSTVLAIVNGEPITRGDVMDAAMKWHQREYLEEYILWKLRQQKIRQLKITNTAAELRERARVELDLWRHDKGEEGLKQFLSTQGLTEASLQQWWIDSGALEQKLTSEKLVIYSLLTEDTIDVDALLFPQDMAEEAGQFAQSPEDFETAYRQAREKTDKVKALTPYPFPAGMAPEFIDKPAEQQLFSMAAPGVSPVVSDTPAGHAVVRLKEKRQGKTSAYADIKEDVMRRILERPPDAIQISRWLQRLRRTSDVRYESRTTR